MGKPSVRNCRKSKGEERLNIVNRNTLFYGMIWIIIEYCIYRMYGITQKIN
jgi:hypothetical protein